MNNSIDYNQLISKKKKNLDFYRRRVEQIVHLKLIWRYDIPNTFYNIKLINDIIYNEKSHFVEAFKEFLIYGDNNEFLKRFYNRKELITKLPKILNFYEQYCKIYANYTAIPESKFMYKNIKRKQKVIDQMQWKYYDLYEEDEDEEKEDLSSKIFNTSALKTINSFTMSLYTNYSSFNNSQSDIEAQDLIRKINYYENLSDLIKNNKNKNENNYLNSNNSNNNNNNNNVKNNSNFINKIKYKHKFLKERNIIRGISTLFNTNSKMKILERKKNINFMNSTTKTDKNVLSINTSCSPKFSNKKIFSTPSSYKNIFKRKNVFLSPNLITNNNKIKSKMSSSSKGKIDSQKNKNYRSTLFSNNKIENIKNNKKNKSNSKSKSKNKNKDKFVYNYNIINKINRNLTHLNTYTGNELYNIKKNTTLNYQSHQKIFKSPNKNIKKKNINNNNDYYTNNSKFISNNNYNKIYKSQSKKNVIPKLNLRKIIHKNVILQDSSSERKTSLRINLFEELSKYFHFHKNNISNPNSTINKRSIIDKNKIQKTPINILQKKMKKEISTNNIKNTKNSSQNRVIKNNIVNIKRIDSNSNINNNLNLRKLQKNHSNKDIIHTDRYKNKISFK